MPKEDPSTAPEWAEPLEETSGAGEADEMEAVFSDGAKWKIPGYTHKMHRLQKIKGKKPCATYWEGTVDGERVFLNTYTRDAGSRLFIGFWKGGGGMISQLTVQATFDVGEAKEMMKELALKYTKKELNKDTLEAAKSRWISERCTPLKKRPAGAGTAKAKGAKGSKESGAAEPAADAEEDEDGEDDEEIQDAEEDDDEEADGDHGTAPGDDSDQKIVKDHGGGTAAPMKRRPAAAPASCATPVKKSKVGSSPSSVLKRPAADAEKGMERIPPVDKNADLQQAGSLTHAASPTPAASASLASPATGRGPAESPELQSLAIPEDCF